MNIGLYSKPNRNILTGFADGVLASGLSPVWQNPSVFTPDQSQKFDLIALWGGAGPKSKEIINTYSKHGIKTLVFENGYVGKDTHAIGVNHHYWIPDFPCPQDRMQKFNLILSNDRKEDGYILVLGQGLQINSILKERVRNLNTDKKIVFRPHPNIPDKIEGTEKINGSLDEALAGACCVLCHTSNSANLAVLRGIPVFCSESCMAAIVGNIDLGKINDPFIPNDEQRIDYFSRLCYATWTKKEIEDGTAINFYINAVLKKQGVTQGKTMSVSDLKGKFEGKTAYIIGKGPSLKYLTKEDFPEDGGLVVPLNEAVKIAESIDLPSSFSIISQQKDGKPECMVEPEKAPLLLHSKESAKYFETHPERYIFDLQKDYGLKDNDVSVIGGNCCSVIAAIEFVKLTGCKKIVFLCFDSYTDNINEYPQDGRLGELHEIPERQAHLDLQKEQIPMHVEGIETKFIKPEKKKIDFTVITLTGDRPKSFKHCREYMARQTVEPTQWIVVDDGKKALPKKLKKGLEYYRRKPGKDEPKHTMRLNMLEALSHVETSKVVIVEDDDWYRDDYLELSLKHLKSHDLVGQDSFYYWNLIKRSYHVINNTKRPAMCLTAFNDNLFPLLETICINSPNYIETEKERKRIDAGSVDLSLWSRWEGSKLQYNEGNNVCVGMKGVEGREGHTLGHSLANDPDYFVPDGDAEVLKGLIGEDVRNYIKV